VLSQRSLAFRRSRLQWPLSWQSSHSWSMLKSRVGTPRSNDKNFIVVVFVSFFW
jgi:hypothetical protein